MLWSDSIVIRLFNRCAWNSRPKPSDRGLIGSTCIFPHSHFFFSWDGQKPLWWNNECPAEKEEVKAVLMPTWLLESLVDRQQLSLSLPVLISHQIPTKCRAPAPEPHHEGQRHGPNLLHIIWIQRTGFFLPWLKLLIHSIRCLVKIIYWKLISSRHIHSHISMQVIIFIHI